MVSNSKNKIEIFKEERFEPSKLIVEDLLVDKLSFVIVNPSNFGL